MVSFSTHLHRFSSLFSYSKIKTAEPKQKPKNPQKANRKKKLSNTYSRPHRDEESKPLDKTQSRTLFAHLKPEKTAKLGDVDFGHRAPHKSISFDNNSRNGYDPHSIFTSLRSSEDNNSNNNLGVVLSAYTESYPSSKPFAADESDPDIIESLPGPPQDIKASIVKARFVTLNWQSPLFTNGDILTYSVYYRQEGSER